MRRAINDREKKKNDNFITLDLYSYRSKINKKTFKLF